MLGLVFDSILKEVSIDFVIVGFQANRLRVLLLKWKGTEKWSLPGGRIYVDEPISVAAVRTLEERTGLKNVFLRQFNTFGNTQRYLHYSREETLGYVKQAIGEDILQLQNLPRTVSVGYYALVDIEKVVAKPDFYTDECSWWDVSDVPKLLFDHNEMIEVALQTLRREIRHQPVGNLLPEKFTMNELQNLFQGILDTELDRRNFHKMMTGYDFLIKLEEKRVGGANRAPHLYRFDYKKYYEALNGGVSF